MCLTLGVGAPNLALKVWHLAYYPHGTSVEVFGLGSGADMLA